jgi:hypothetical protein
MSHSTHHPFQEDPVSDVAELETTLRGFLRRKLSGYTTDKLAELKLSTGESVLASLAKNQMLPDVSLFNKPK